MAAKVRDEQRSVQAKLAKLKKELLEPGGGGGGGGERGFEVHKVGDARVGFVGTCHQFSSAYLYGLSNSFQHVYSLDVRLRMFRPANE
jgi:ribosome-interacting GTPase 1